MQLQATFMDEIVSGKEPLNDIDDWVNHWHDDETLTMGLQAYLGLTDTEYELWSTRGNAVLPTLLRARRMLTKA